MKLTTEQLRQVIKEELDEVMEATTVNCCELPLPESGEYEQMTEEQLLAHMCRPSHWKVYYAAQQALMDKGYKGPYPKLLPPDQRNY